MRKIDMHLIDINVIDRQTDVHLTEGDRQTDRQTSGWAEQ